MTCSNKEILTVYFHYMTTYEKEQYEYPPLIVHYSYINTNNAFWMDGTFYISLCLCIRYATLLTTFNVVMKQHC